MRVLVTGGAGYIGTVTATELLRAGHDVTLLDSLVRADGRARSLAPLVELDVRDAEGVERTLRDRRIEAVVHLAALKSVSESLRAPLEYFDTNVQGSVRLLGAMQRAGVSRLVFSSTCAIYAGDAAPPIDESAPIAPGNPYGESKLAAERAIHWASGTSGIRHVTLRYFNAAGATDDGRWGESWSHAENLIPIALRTAAGLQPHVEIYGTAYPTPDGTPIRDYIHVVDLADAHVRALAYLAGGGGSETLNLGTGRGHSVREVLATVAQTTGRPVPVVEGPPRAGDPASVWAEPARARRVLGWAPTRELDDMIASAWRWQTREPTSS